MKKQPKKLTLNKETLRDLTMQNAGDVRGGDNTKGLCSWYCTWTNCNRCHGKTYNKRCGH